MKERNHVSFNHGYLCELLRAANDDELANVINDVQRIQNQRKAARKQMHAIAIKNAIDAAIKDGYIVTITTTDDLKNPDCIIHSNNIFCSAVDIIAEEDE